MTSRRSPFGPSRVVDLADQLADHRDHVLFAVFCLSLARLDFGDIEKLIDQAKEPQLIAMKRMKVLVLLCRVFHLEKRFQRPQGQRQGRAKLV